MSNRSQLPPMSPDCARLNAAPDSVWAKWTCQCGLRQKIAHTVCEACKSPRQPAPVAVPGGSGQKGGQSIRFTIPGEPRGKQRARSAGNIHYTPKQTRDYEARIAYLFRCAHAGFVPWAGGVPLRLDVQAYFKLPKSASKKWRAMCAGETVPFTGTPDGDNILKIVQDALNSKPRKGIVGAYHDDSQLAGVKCDRWRTTGEDRIEVAIEEA